MIKVKNQAGFGVIEILIVLMVVLAIGAGGTIVYLKKHHDHQVSGPCPPGETYGYPPLPNATEKVCLNPNIAAEPVIYLYPKQTENVSVKLSYPAGLIKSEPAYGGGWNVRANPDGSLVNLSDSRSYPYLFWEGNPPQISFDMTKGFVVPGGQTRTFFKRQLALMGLNQTEIDTFLGYWAPKMESNKYNLVHFTGSDYTDYAKLTITPKPDSLLRVFMAYQRLEAKVKVSPQSFPVFHRNGFTAVEWGGTELH